MKLELVPQLQIQQNLSLRLQQSAHILQLSVQELQTLLQDSLQNNPLLEPEPEPDPAPPVREGLTRSTHHDDGGLPSQDYLGSAPRSRDELILENVRLSRADERCRALCALIVNALDDNGYLREDFADLLPPDYEKVPLAEWESALALVQSLSIPGTGARNLQEALRLQVQARSRLSGPVRQALLDLIATELPALAQGDWTGVQTRLSLPSPLFAQALRELQQLDPNPGLAYLQPARQAIVPDVYVYRDGSQWKVAPDPRSLPRVRIHHEYADLLEAQARSTKDRALHDTLTQARWLSDSLSMRRATVCRVARLIVQRQALFFELGQQALQPLRICDLAKELELHESTISRATMNKYMSTPFGTLSFRHFFSGELETGFGGSCSTALVKEQIRRLVAQECRHKPLSDVELHQALRDESVELSKRTVTKYRLQLGIPNARERLQRARLRALSGQDRGSRPN
ncbi:MAG: RNA polymerase factor sigma-54 [Alcaligenes sp.]